MHYVVSSGASYNNQIIRSGGGLSVYNGGLAFNDIIDGGTLLIGSGANIVQTSFTSNGGNLVLDRGFISEPSNFENLQINSNVSITVQNSAVLLNGSFSNIPVFINSGGSAVGNIFNNTNQSYLVNVSSGGYFVSNTMSGGFLRLGPAVAKDNTFIDMNIVILSNAGLGSSILSNTSASVMAYRTAYNNVLYGKSYLIVGTLGFAIGNIVNSGASIVTQRGQISLTDNTFNSGSYLTVVEGQVYNNLTYGAIVSVVDGLVFSNTFVDTTITTDRSGQTNIRTNIFQGGVLNANGGLIYSNDMKNMSINILSLGQVGNNNITSSFITINSDRAGFNSNTINGGQVDIYGGSVDGNVFSSGSLLNVYSGGSLGSDTIISSGANAILYDGATLSGTLVLEKGGYVAITTSTGGVISLTDNTTPIYLLDQTTKMVSTNTGLVISGTGSATTVINGFSGADSDQITLANIQTSNVINVTYPDMDHVVFTLKDGTETTLNITGIGNYGYTLASDVNGNLVYEVCFLAGTMISTKSGLCAVEELKVGDEIITYDYKKPSVKIAKIKWVGHKHMSVNPNKINDEAGYPVRILKNAIADGAPNKDLLITAEHCLFFDDKFIPVRMLVNGSSIFYDISITSYDYYHIETEEHSIILADGILTETYLDTGNRHIFNRDQKVIQTSLSNHKDWQKDAAAPLVVQRDIVEPLYHHLVKRAKKLGYINSYSLPKMTQDADLHLITSTGCKIYAKQTMSDGKVWFELPSNVDYVWIMSRVSRLSDVIGSFVDDRRYLGVLIGQISLQQGGKKYGLTQHIDQKDLFGWHGQESTSYRWTNGKAFIALNKKRYSNVPTYLTLHILSNNFYIVEEDKIQRKA